MDYYNNYIEAQKKLATWEQSPFAQKVALELLSFAQEIRLKPIVKAFIGRGHGLYQTTCITFPQLNLHIQTTSIREKEKLEVESINKYNVFYPIDEDIRVIDSTKGLETVTQQLKQIKEEIKQLMQQRSIMEWDISDEGNVDKIKRNKKTIHINDNQYFYKVVDIIRLFGDPAKAVMRGGKPHLYEPNTSIWWPKLYKNKDGWENEMSSDGLMITEKHMDPQETQRLVDDYLELDEHYKIVFPRYELREGGTILTFKGVFKLDKEATKEHNCGIFRRVREEATLYALPEEI